jgi:hypothetical protein
MGSRVTVADATGNALLDTAAISMVAARKDAIFAACSGRATHQGGLEPRLDVMS